MKPRERRSTLPVVFKLPKRINLLILLILSGLFAVACSFKDPVLPTWSIPVNVPIASENFRMGDEIVNDSTIIAVGADSLITIAIEGDLEEVELGLDEFTLEAIDTTHLFDMGELEMDSLAEMETGNVAFGQIFPGISAFVVDGQTVQFTMPETTFTPAPREIDPGDFRSLHIVSGDLFIEFFNTLPFPLGPNSAQPQGIEIVIQDSLGTQVAVTHIDEVVPTGGSAARTTPIGDGDTWIYAPLFVEYRLPVAEETQFPLNAAVVDTTGIGTDLRFVNVTADEAVAKVEPQDILDVLSFAITQDGNRAREAHIENGTIQLSFTNNAPLEAHVTFTLPAIFDAGGEAVEESVVLPPESSQSLYIPLQDGTIMSPDGTGNYVDSIEVVYNTVTMETEEFVHIRSSDYVSVNINTGEISFGAFAGYLAGETFEIDPVENDSLADYEGIPTNIELQDVEMVLSVENEVNVENLNLNLTLTGFHHEDGVITDSATIVVDDYEVMPGEPGNPSLSVISVDGDEVAEFLNILPDAIRTEGHVQASGEIDVNQQSDIAGSYAFSTPLRLQINGDAVVQGDVEILAEEDIDEDVRNSADDNFEEGSLSMRIRNHTPIGGTVRLIVSADPQRQDLYDDSYFNPELEFIKEISVIPAEVDPVTGFVLDVEESDFELTLTRGEFELFNNPPLKVGYELRFDATDGVIALRSTDFIEVSGLARIVIIVRD